MTKILVTGGSGLLGSALCFYFRNKADIVGTYSQNKVSLNQVTMAQVDFGDPVATRAVINRANPDVLINCVALTNLDLCEENPVLSRKVNVDSLENISQTIKSGSTKLIHISTDCVFDGESSNYVEGSKANPKNQYGRDKLESEQVALGVRNALVLRTNIFGWNVTDRLSLAEWVIAKLTSGCSINGFSDVYFSSIYTFLLAQIIERALEKNLSGLYHATSSTSMSKYEFARKLAVSFGYDESLVKSSSIDSVAFKARRGKNMTMISDKLGRDLGYSIPSMEDSLNQFHNDFNKGIPGLIRDMGI